MIYQPERILLLKQINSLVPENAGIVIDVGGGDGSRYKSLFLFDEYKSIDIDAASKPDIIADAYQLPITSNSVDTVLCSQVLEHVIDPDKVLAEIFRILKPQGICILTVPFFNEIHSEPNDYWRWTSYGIVKIVERTGFQIQTIQKRGGYFSCHAQIRIRKFIEKYDVFSSKLRIKLFRLPSKVYSYCSINLDNLFQSKYQSKFALGWALKITKPEL